MLTGAPAAKRQKTQNGNMRKKGEGEKKQFECRGCPTDAEGCGKPFPSQSQQKRHEDRGLRKHKCPVKTCPRHSKGFGLRGDMHNHVRSKHPADMEKLGIAPVQKQLPIPPRYDTPQMREEWFFVYKMASNHIRDDHRSTRRTTRFLTSIDNYEGRRRMTLSIMEKVDTLGMREPGFVDPLGGVVPNGVLMFANGGIFQLSLDRINNRQHHLLHGSDPLSNLRFGMLGTNVPSSLDNAPEYGFKGGLDASYYCAILRKLHDQPTSAADIKKALERENYVSKTVRGGKHVYSCLGQSAHNIFQCDTECQAAFPNARAFHKYVFEILEKQQAKCPLQKMLFADRTACDYHPFKPSIDAIKPTLGHVRGNLRIVCAFLNNTNMDKRKTNPRSSDQPSSWTPELWKNYIGARRGRKRKKRSS